MKYSKILILVGVGCFVGFPFVFGVDLQLGNLSKTGKIDVNVNEAKPKMKQGIGEYKNLKQVSNKDSDSEKSYDNSDYYQVIVDNNLFRPLGWKPPNKEPEYSLVGTTVDPTGNRSQAFVVEERSNQFFMVGVGEKVGDALVKEIEDKTVTLYKDGEIITLKRGSMGFLGSGASSSREGSSSRYERGNDKERTVQRGTRSKSTGTAEDRKRMEKMIRENEKKMKAVMKETQQSQKKMEQAKRKAVTIEKKKIIAIDKELKGK